MFEKKFKKKNVGKIYLKKISTIKNYNKINQCDTIFALFPLLDSNRQKDREQWKSLHMRIWHRFKIGSFALALHARNIAISAKLAENYNKLPVEHTKVHNVIAPSL